MDLGQWARVVCVLVPRVVRKGSFRRLGEDRRQVGLVIDARLHLSTRSSGTLPGVLCDIVDGELDSRGRRLVLLELSTHRPSVSVIVIDRHLAGLGHAKELRPLAMGSLPIDGEVARRSDASNILVKSSCGLAVWVGED